MTCGHTDCSGCDPAPIDFAQSDTGASSAAPTLETLFKDVSFQPVHTADGSTNLRVVFDPKPEPSRWAGLLGIANALKSGTFQFGRSCGILITGELWSGATGIFALASMDLESSVSNIRANVETIQDGITGNLSYLGATAPTWVPAVLLLTAAGVASKAVWDAYTDTEAGEEKSEKVSAGSKKSRDKGTSKIPAARALSTLSSARPLTLH